MEALGKGYGLKSGAVMVSALQHRYTCSRYLSAPLASPRVALRRSLCCSFAVDSQSSSLRPKPACYVQHVVSARAALTTDSWAYDESVVRAARAPAEAPEDAKINTWTQHFLHSQHQFNERPVVSRSRENCPVGCRRPVAVTTPHRPNLPISSGTFKRAYCNSIVKLKN